MQIAINTVYECPQCHTVHRSKETADFCCDIVESYQCNQCDELFAQHADARKHVVEHFSQQSREADYNDAVINGYGKGRVLWDLEQSRI